MSESAASNRMGVGGQAVRLALLISLWVGTVAVATIMASPASAQCYANPNDAAWYVSGGNANNSVRSVRTNIGWRNPSDLCSSSTSYSISIVNGSGWVQVGWLKRPGYSNSVGYCERNPQPDGSGAYMLNEYTSVPHAEQSYDVFKNTAGAFECRIAGEVKQTIAASIVGFEHGGWVPVQAEAHQRYQQLGPIAPEWLTFSEASKVLQGASAWTNMDVNNVDSSYPAIWHFTTTGVTRGFKVNTDVSH